MPNRQKQEKKGRKIWLIALSVLVIVAASIVYYKHAQHDRAVDQERADYAAATKDIDNLTSQIIAKVGTPDDEQKNQSCGHASVEFGVGDLFCETSHYLAYKSDGLDASTQLARKIEGNGLRGGKLYFSDLSEIGNQTPPVDILSEEFNSHDLSCSIGYSYQQTTRSEKNFMSLPGSTIKKLDDALVININCGSRPAKGAYFPLEAS